MSAPMAFGAPKSLNGFVGGAGGINTGGLFSQPRDIAVYTGNTPSRNDDTILIAEAFGSGNNRVQRLDADGNFELLWGQDSVRPGFAGNTGDGYEICRASISSAAGCKSAPAGARAGELNGPTGLAADQGSGAVYVIDRGNRRVQQFTLAGEFVRGWGWDVVPDGQPGDTPSDQFEVCTTVCKAGSAGSNAGQFADADLSSIAVSAVAPNHVFVTDSGNRRVQEFESDGDFVRAWGFDVSPGGVVSFETCEAAPPGCQAATAGTTDGQVASGHPRHVAVDADGIVYLSDSNGDARIPRFDSSPAPAAATDATGSVLEPLPAPSLLSAGSTAGLEIDPATGHLLVVRDRSFFGGAVLAVVREISNPGATVSGPPPNPTVADTHLLADEADGATGDLVKNLGYDPATGNIYLTIPALFRPSQGNFTGCSAGQSQSCVGFATLATSSGEIGGTLGSPSDVGATTADLIGTVGPAGGIASYNFQISSDGANWIDATAAVFVAGDDPSTVSGRATGLQPNTSYRVRLVVTKQTGIDATASSTSNESFLLTDAARPDVTTLGTTERTERSVRLRGLIDPNGSSTTYRFEYGPAEGSFDHHIPMPDAQAGSGNSPSPVVQQLAGLLPDTAYHYRLVASNAQGTTVGEPVTFSTTLGPASPPPPAGRGYELVSPSDKISGVGVGIWYHGPAAVSQIGVAAHDKERFAVRGTFGASLVNGDYAFADDWALAERTPQGWASHPLVSRRAYGSQTLTFLGLSGVTPDLSRIGISNVGLKFFSEQEPWINETTGSLSYLTDWTSGRWELFGPTDPAQGGGLGATLRIADDGQSAVAAATTRGLAGAQDPTSDLSGNVASVFLDELPATGPSDQFPGSSTRSVVNVCTAGTTIPSIVDVSGTLKQASAPCPPAAPTRSHSLISGDRGATLGADREDIISSDGARIFFQSPNPNTTGPSCSGVAQSTACPAQLFVRQRQSNDSFVTRWISRSEVRSANGASADQDASLMGRTIFEGASGDGDKVFFRSAAPLTADDRNGEGTAPPPGGIVSGSPSESSWDLYMYDMPDAPDADPATGDLVRISAGPTGTGDCNSPRGGEDVETGALRFASDDGSRLYFICAAPLPGVPLTGDGTVAHPGGTPLDRAGANLYGYDAAKPLAERWHFIARLPRSTTLGGCATTGITEGMVLGPNDEQDANLHTNENNCVRGVRNGSFITFMTDGQLTDDDPNVTSGDIYAYDAIQDELTRISGPQGGNGGAYPCAPPEIVDCYADDGIGSALGGMTLPKLGVADDPGGIRVVFFESRSRLIPADTDDAYDVYQWRNGTLSLISPATGGNLDSFYAGSDRSGLNVYIATRERLTWEDKDSVLDVYSARRGGGFPDPSSTAGGCDVLADQCQSSGEAPPSTSIETDAPGQGNPQARRRVALTISNPSSSARKRAARGGALLVRVSANAPTTVSVFAKARFKTGLRKATNRTAQHLEGRIAVTFKLRLTKAARRQLRTNKTLHLSLLAAPADGRQASRPIILKRR